MLCNFHFCFRPCMILLSRENEPAPQSISSGLPRKPESFRMRLKNCKFKLKSMVKDYTLMTGYTDLGTDECEKNYLLTDRS